MDQPLYHTPVFPPPNTHTVYSVELTTLVKMHGTKVPVVVKDCIEDIEKRGKRIECLFLCLKCCSHRSVCLY